MILAVIHMGFVRDLQAYANLRKYINRMAMAVSRQLCVCAARQLACGAVAGLRLFASRQLACGAVAGLLFGGCVHSPPPADAGRASVQANAARQNALQTGGTVQAGGTVQTGGSTPAAPTGLGNIPNAGNPAGIQLYAQTQDGIFLLVADHAPPSRRGWAGFGGAADAGETIAETAARETEEETRGYFRQEDLLEAIRGQEPLFDGKFAFYLVQVDWVPAEVISSHPIGNNIAFAERGPYAWVPYAEIERCLQDHPTPSSRKCLIDPHYLPTKNRHTNWFWPVWLNNLRILSPEQKLKYFR